MKRTNVGSFRALLKSMPRYRLFDPCIVGCIVLRGNEKRNTKRTTVIAAVVSPWRRGYRSFFVLVVEEVTNVRLGPFACCTPWQLRAHVHLRVGLSKKKKLVRRDACVYFDFTALILCFYSPNYPSFRDKVCRIRDVPERGNSYFSLPVF